MSEHEAAPDLATMLNVAETQQTRAEQELGIDDTVLYATWGVAWLIGFGLMYLARAHGVMPFPVSGAIFAALLVAAAAVTAFYVIRRTAGITGVSARTGAMYGWSWFLGFTALGLIMGGVARAGAGDDLMALLWASTSCLVVGVLYLTAGALWQDVPQYVIGVWILLSGAVGALVGVPENLAVMSLAGGGGFLVAAVWLRVRRSAAA